MNWIFDLYDVGKDGYISRQELVVLIRAVNDLLGPTQNIKELIENVDEKANWMLNVKYRPLVLSFKFYYNLDTFIISETLRFKATIRLKGGSLGSVSVFASKIHLRAENRTRLTYFTEFLNMIGLKVSKLLLVAHKFGKLALHFLTFKLYLLYESGF